MLDDIREWLFRSGPRRDGQADALEDLATSDPTPSSAWEPGDAAHATTETEADDPKVRRRRLAARPETIIVESLAQKVLDSWLQNRQQTLYPLTMNFRTLEPAQTALLIEAMAAAMTADGETEVSEREQTDRALTSVGGGAAERQMLVGALAEPKPLARLLQELQDANLGAYAYAASLLAINQRNNVNRLYLEYLAARLAVPAEVVSSLNRRYRM